MQPNNQQDHGILSALPGYVSEHSAQQFAAGSNWQRPLYTTRGFPNLKEAGSHSHAAGNAMLAHDNTNSVQAAQDSIQHTSTAAAAWCTDHNNASNVEQSNITPEVAQLYHGALFNLLAAAAHAGREATNSGANAEHAAGSQHHPLSTYPAALHNADGHGLLSHQGPTASFPMPELPAINTTRPHARSSNGGVKECCHCGKTEEKQWRRYTTVPPDDTRPLCNRCFMWRRNHGGSTSSNQDILPGPEALLASNTPRLKGPRGLFRQDSKNMGAAGVPRARSSSAGRYSAAAQSQEYEPALTGPGYLQASSRTCADLAAAGAANAGNSMYDIWSAVQLQAASHARQGPWGISTGSHVPSEVQQQSISATQEVPAGAATAVPTASHSLPSSPVTKHHSSPRNPLAIKKTLSKSPLSKAAARRTANHGSNPGTPSHQHHSSECGSWELQQLQQYGANRRSSSSPVRRSISSGFGPAAAGCRSPAIQGPRVSTHRYNTAEPDAEAAQAAAILADLMLLQAGPGSSAEGMQCWQRVTSAGSKAAAQHSAAASAGALSERGLAPDTPVYSSAGQFAGQPVADDESYGVDDLMSAVEDLPWTQHARDTPDPAVRGSPARHSAGSNAVSPAANRFLSGSGQALSAVLGQDLCNALTAATAGCLAAAANATHVELPVGPEVIQAFTAAMLAGVPVGMMRLSDIQASFDAMQQQIESSPEMQQLMQRVMQGE